MALIQEIIILCQEVQDETEFLKTLAGKAADAKWAVADPGLAMLKAMAHTQADVILVKASELKAMLP